jgi:hypothetical protein
MGSREPSGLRTVKGLITRIHNLLWGDDDEWNLPHCETCTCGQLDNYDYDDEDDEVVGE